MRHPRHRDTLELEERITINTSIKCEFMQENFSTYYIIRLGIKDHTSLRQALHSSILIVELDVLIRYVYSIKALTMYTYFTPSIYFISSDHVHAYLMFDTWHVRG